MAGLDPAISPRSVRQITGSTPVMTRFGFVGRRAMEEYGGTQIDSRFELVQVSDHD
jgi:hypothetical protein